MRNGALTSGPEDERGDNGEWRLTASGSWGSGRSTVSSPGGGVGCTSSATPLFDSHRRGRAAHYGSTLIPWPTGSRQGTAFDSSSPVAPTRGGNGPSRNG